MWEIQYLGVGLYKLVYRLHPGGPIHTVIRNLTAGEIDALRTTLARPLPTA